MRFKYKRRPRDWRFWRRVCLHLGLGRCHCETYFESAQQSGSTFDGDASWRQLHACCLRKPNLLIYWGWICAAFRRADAVMLCKVVFFCTVDLNTAILRIFYWQCLCFYMRCVNLFIKVGLAVHFKLHGHARKKQKPCNNFLDSV